MSLSSKFASLSGASKAAGIKKPNNKAAIVQKSNKPNQTGKKTQPVQSPAAKGKKGKGKPVIAPVVAKGKKGGKGGNKNIKGNDKKGAKGKGKPVREKKEIVQVSDLDMDMDTYWFKAGKGPDPKAAALDREMDSYFEAKNAAKEDESAVEIIVETNAIENII
jgi:hypothetical protein